MKRILFVSMLSLVMVANLAFAQTSKTTPSAKAAPVEQKDTVVVTVDDQAVTLDVDGDYTWKTQVTDKGLKSGDDYDAARLLCKANDAAWAAYNEARTAKDYTKARQLGPRSDVKGWAALNQGRTTIGEWDDEDGLYRYDVNASADNLAAAKQYAIDAKAYGEAADAHGVGPKSGANSVAGLNKQIQKFADAITSIEEYQAKQKNKKHKAKKAKAVATPTEDE